MPAEQSRRRSRRRSCLKNEGNSRSGPTKKVWFDQIHVREYPIILGDNPSTVEGAPITIGWKPQHEMTLEIEYFELYRPKRRRSAYVSNSVGSYKKFPYQGGISCGGGRELSSPLKLSPKRRVELAVAGGSSLRKIGKTCVEMARIQAQRTQSARAAATKLTFLPSLSSSSSCSSSFKPSSLSSSYCSSSTKTSSFTSRKGMGEWIEAFRVQSMLSQQEKKQKSFSRIPNEVPRILAEWNYGATRAF